METVAKSVWPDWRIEDPIGIGSYGTVYRAKHVRESDRIAAIKVISIPGHESEVESLRHEGLGEEEIQTYFSELVNDFISEIRMMELLRDAPNVVHVEDYAVVEKEEGLGWEIYIRMEYLTPFNAFVCDKKLTEADVIRIGCDLCSALEICEKHNIIHRDIKPENILVNALGEYKLGDFGIARKLEHMTFGLSQKGTVNYMAPEVMYSYDYDGRADIYSLGLVLYRLLNRNRLPFMDTEKQLLNPQERRTAVENRLRGEALPPPCQASAPVAEVILKACDFAQEKRYSSASEFKDALLKVASENGITLRRMGEAEHSSVMKTQGKASLSRKRRIAVAAGLVLALAIAGFAATRGLYQPDAPSNTLGDGEGTHTEDITPEDTADISAKEWKLNLASLPEKREYFVGDSLDTAGMRLQIESGDSKEIIEAGYSVSPEVFSTVGEQTVVVSYEGESLSFTVQVQEVVCTGLEILRFPIKTEYTVGEPLATEGLSVAKVWNNGATEILYEGITVSPDILDTAGQQLVTVTYEEMQTEFYVTVQDMHSAAEGDN